MAHGRSLCPSISGVERRTLRARSRCDSLDCAASDDARTAMEKRAATKRLMGWTSKRGVGARGDALSWAWTGFRDSGVGVPHAARHASGWPARFEPGIGADG